ncbi:hypothetical protein [Rhodococcus qingshengii]|uniref:hypothetical protein n=1 Tax=Rhodococcus qingshengii TaxID=334542 RepID=UPI001C5E203C|nr:hypothetical protein [Rhodococcus qingshengii]MBW4813147.1 hypothetical protein [Rhodococcus qingshengii]
MSKTESFEFLNELALAFRSGETHPRPGNVPVLEGIRAVLAHLTAAGRLIPAGGMALAAEDVRKFIIAIERHYPESEAELLARLRALVPATEPAEETAAEYVERIRRFQSTTLPAPAEPAEDAPCAICNVNETNHAGVSYYHPFTTELGPFDDDGNDRPAPAEPAEKETKAECLSRWDELRCGLDAGHAGSHEQGKCSDPDWAIWPGDHANPTTSAEHIEEEGMLAARGEGWYEGYEVGLEYGPIAASGEEYDGPINPYDVPASSPVVPAPTETGPTTWCAITGADSNPGGEHAYVTVRVPKDFVSGQSMADLAGAGKSRELARLLAPFVAAEEG